MKRGIFLAVLLVFFLSAVSFAQTVIRDDYRGATGKFRKDSLGKASNVTEMEVVADDGRITVTLRGPFFYNYVHHKKDAHKTPPGDLFISSGGWKVKGTAPYTGDTFTRDEGWDYVVSLFDKAVYKLDWSKIEWSRPKPGSVIYRPDQAWRGGYGGFVTWADIKLTDTSLVISFPINAIFPELDGPEDSTATTAKDSGTGEPDEGVAEPDTGLEMGLHWTMMCGNDVIEGAFSLPAVVYSDEEEAQEFPMPRPTAWAMTPLPPMVPWTRDFREGTILPVYFHHHHHHHTPHRDVPEPTTLVLLFSGLPALGFFSRSRKKG